MSDAIPTNGEMSRQHRVTLGTCMYGLYVLGLATTPSEECDEDCAMNNMGVPYRYEDLTATQRATLDRVAKRDLSEITRIIDEHQ